MPNETPRPRDRLFPDDRPVDPLCGRFYRTVADLVAGSTGSVLPDAPRVCDVGGGAGRFLGELFDRSWGARRAGPGRAGRPLCAWARRLLCGAPFDGLVPVVTRAEAIEFRRVDPADLPTPIPSAVVRQSAADQLTCPDGHFDLVACLNVVDRVARPATLVADLCRMLRRGGVLVLSSPFEFRAGRTADAHRLTDLRDVLPDRRWSILADTPRVPYEFRAYDRGRISLDSQVVVAARR